MPVAKMKEGNPLQKKTGGFTVIETLIAVMVLLTSIVGPMSVASKGLYAAFYARDEITAFYLAQEGLEFVRNFRDTTKLMHDKEDIDSVNAGGAPAHTSDQWLDGLEDCDTAVNADGCIIDARLSPVDPNAILPCSGKCTVVQFDSGTGLFGYDTGGGGSWENTKYERTIKINKITMPNGKKDEALITSEVRWTNNIFAPLGKSATVRLYTTNWQREAN